MPRNSIRLPLSAQGFAEFMVRTEYFAPASDGERREIYRLRYRAYVWEGAYPPAEHGMVTDAIDDLDNCQPFGVRVDGQLAGSIRMSLLSAQHPDSSAMRIFPDVLRPMIDAGIRIVDPSRIVTDPDRRPKTILLPVMVARLGFLALMHCRADLVLSTPRPEHYAFYRKMFGFRILAEPRLGMGLLKPVALMQIDRDGILAHIRRHYPFVEGSADEIRRIFTAGAIRPLWRAAPEVC